jgi:hypothetical protein
MEAAADLLDWARPQRGPWLRGQRPPEQHIHPDDHDHRHRDGKDQPADLLVQAGGREVGADAGEGIRVVVDEMTSQCR